MLTGRRFRLEFTGEQADFAERIAGVCRAVWNTGLEQRRYYRHRGAWINYPEQARQLAEAKADHRWLAEAPSHCLPQTLMDLDKACRTHGTFRVRWRPSFRFPEGNKMVVERLNRRHARVKLPKLGWVKFRLSRPLDGMVLRSATLTRDGTHWFVSFLVDDGRETPAAHAVPGSAVGLDRGVVAAIATSDSQLIDREFLIPIERQRVARLQRQLSRCRRRGRNRDKTRAALAEIRGRERHRRRDLCAQAARRLASANAVVVLEDLTRRNAARRVGRWIRSPVRAKRYFGAPPVRTPGTRTSMLHATSWPQGLRSWPVKTRPGLGLSRCSRNQQETARNYCSNPTPQHERVGIPRLHPWGGRQVWSNG